MNEGIFFVRPGSEVALSELFSIINAFDRCACSWKIEQVLDRDYQLLYVETINPGLIPLVDYVLRVRDIMALRYPKSVDRVEIGEMPI